MSKDQIKLEINKVLDHLSDQALEDVLNLLKKLDKKTVESNADLLHKIISEDKKLLARLAQ
jgi:hypothetical protein